MAPETKDLSLTETSAATITTNNVTA
jgi:hypothetical protein